MSHCAPNKVWIGAVISLISLVPLQAERASIQILGSFSGANGSGPYSGIITLSDDFSYGTTHQGGAFGLPFGHGTIFRISAGGALETLHSFNQVNGARPYATLTLGPDGALYGTTLVGGSANSGTLFRFSTNGSLTTLIHFAGANGARPSGRLVLTPDGEFIGTTQSGGTHNAGTVFRATTNGNLTVIGNFDGTNGANPYAGVVLQPSGEIWGTAVNGGMSGNGSVFKLLPGGTIQAVVSFNQTNGANPYGGLLRVPSGDLYGTTAYGGAANFGTVFRINSGSIFQLLHEFAGNKDGANPWAGLSLGADGYLYGTCILGGQGGGVSGWGTVFQCTTNGGVTPLFAFGVNSNGVSPYAELSFDGAGRLQGTTFSLGEGLKGTVFRLAVGATQLTATVSANKFLIQWPGWPGKSYILEHSTNLATAGWNVIGAVIATSNVVTWETAIGANRDFFRTRNP